MSINRGLLYALFCDLLVFPDSVALVMTVLSAPIDHVINFNGYMLFSNMDVLEFTFCAIARHIDVDTLSVSQGFQQISYTVRTV